MPAAPYVPEVFPHRWLAADAEFKTWDQIEPWYRRLLERPIESTEDLEAWLFDLGALAGVTVLFVVVTALLLRRLDPRARRIG